MTNQPEASRLAREAFELWQAGKHSNSKALYQKAISLAALDHWGLSSYHGELACVLNELGDHEAATHELERSLEVELSQGNAEGLARCDHRPLLSVRPIGSRREPRASVGGVSSICQPSANRLVHTRRSSARSLCPWSNP